MWWRPPSSAWLKGGTPAFISTRMVLRENLNWISFVLIKLILLSMLIYTVPHRMSVTLRVRRAYTGSRLLASLGLELVSAVRLGMRRSKDYLPDGLLS